MKGSSAGRLARQPEPSGVSCTTRLPGLTVVWWSTASPACRIRRPSPGDVGHRRHHDFPCPLCCRAVHRRTLHGRLLDPATGKTGCLDRGLTPRGVIGRAPDCPANGRLPSAQPRWCAARPRCPPAATEGCARKPHATVGGDRARPASGSAGRPVAKAAEPMVWMMSARRTAAALEALSPVRTSRSSISCPSRTACGPRAPCRCERVASRRYVETTPTRGAGADTVRVEGAAS